MSAAAALRPLCERVGLFPQEPLKGAAEGAALWMGPYAALLLWPAGTDDLLSAATCAEGWFAQVLSGEEDRRNARVLDGYLLLLLPAPPDEGMEPDLRRIELSTRICRKHVVWADPAGQWRRFDSVTVLGLPDGVTTASSEPEWPALPETQRALWADIQDAGGGPAAALAEEKRT